MKPLPQALSLRSSRLKSRGYGQWNTVGHGRQTAPQDCWEVPEEGASVMLNALPTSRFLEIGVYVDNSSELWMTQGVPGYPQKSTNPPLIKVPALKRAGTLNSIKF
jgi:hypothetical protein